MSPSPEPEARDSRADGFTLVEVIVALGIFMVLAAAVAPLLVGGLRSTAVARDISQSKGVAQAQLEKMRDMPFYVGRAAGDYKDVLDTYYRDRCPPGVTAPCAAGATATVIPSCATTTLTALPPTNWTGYVGASGTHCVWEPAGQLYRVVINPVVAPGLGVFSTVISTQFLSAGDSPTAVAPASDYTSQTAVKDTPPSTQIGVTVAVFYKSASGVHYTVTYSQVEQANPIAPLLTSEARSSTVRVSSALDADTTLLEQLGVVNLSGELYTGSRVVTTASAATAGNSLGQQINGAQVNFVAPVDQAAASANAGNVSFPTSGCNYQCFGDTSVDQASALASNGLPRAGTAAAPVRAMIPTGANSDGFRFSNATTTIPALKLDASKPMVSLDTTTPGSMLPISNCATTAGSVPAYLTGTGFLDATSSAVSACATAQSNAVRLFPTTFAPKGVVRITLDNARASCSVTKPGPGIADAAYTASISYWNGSSYTTLTPALSSSNTVDPLAGLPLGTSVDASGLTLGDYISSWRSLTLSGVRKTTGTTTAQATLPGAISITTRPTRDSDPTSTISIDVGTVSCDVGDSR